MFTWKRLLLAAGGLALLALLLVTLLLPGIIIDKARGWVAAETGRTLTIGSISINPVLLAIEINDLVLSEQDPAVPFVSWQALRVSLSPQSLVHRAPIISELRLDRPVVHLERLTADSYNFSDLIPAPPAEAASAAPADPARFSINNLSINDGRIDLVDSSLAQPIHHSIHDLQLHLPAIGNLPYQVENPVKPVFRAVINDSPINLEGEFKPFTDTQELRFDLVLENLDLPFYLGYIPGALPVELRSGRLSLDLTLLYRLAPETGGEFELSGKLDLTSLDIRDRLQERLFFLPLLRAEIAPSQPLKKQLHLAALRVYNLEVQLSRDQAGGWNHARMAQQGGAPPGQERSGEETAPFRLLVDTFEVRDGEIFFTDLLPEGGFKTVARHIDIDIDNFALDAQEGIPVSLSLRTERDESLTIKGQFLLDPFTLDLQTDLRDLEVGAYAPYYLEAYSGPLGGRLGLQASLAVNPGQPLLVSDGRLAWRDAYMAFNEQEGLGIGLAEITGIAYDLRRNRLEIDAARYHDGRVSFSRDKANHWSFLSRNFPVLAKLTETPATPPEPATPQEGSPFSYHVGEFAIIDSEFTVIDNLPTTPVRLQLRDFNLAFSNLAAPERVESPFNLSTTFQEKARIEISGSASLADQSITLNSRLKGIPLATFAPYLAEQAKLILADGFLDARLRSTVNAAAENVHAAFDGDLGISRFHLLESLHREDLLKWDNLLFAGIAGTTSPLELNIASITLSDYFAKVLIDEEARLNLVEAFRTTDAPPSAETAATAAEVPATNDRTADDSPQAPPRIGIGTVTLQGGRIDFTDRNLPRPFHADMRELGGRIEGLASSADTRATVDLRGRLRNRSPLTISGAVNPLAEQLFVDLKLDFTDIELSPLSPYSGTYAGYLIEKGKLNLALEYFIEDGRLKAKNKVFLDQFSFGDKVESEKATSLPVKLAVALLKDRKGEIHLDIPVTGSLDDPQFSIAGVVWTIIKNLLVKAATSPFALLGALVGGGDEDFSQIIFDYGSLRLNGSEQEKLQQMAKALAERPGLEVEVSGFIDPEQDVEGYRRELLSRQVKRLKYLDLVKAAKVPDGVREEDVTVTQDEYADYLWEVYREADFPKPRNFIGMTKKLPVPEMEKLIYTSTAVSADDLAELARGRALAVQDYLIEGGQIARERIFLKESDIAAEPDKAVASRARVELGATVR